MESIWSHPSRLFVFCSVLQVNIFLGWFLILCCRCFFYISILCCRLQGWMQQSCKLIFPAVQPHFWIKLKFYTKILNKTSFLNSSTSACRQIWWMPTNQQTFLFINFKLKPKLAFVIDLQIYIFQVLDHEYIYWNYILNRWWVHIVQTHCRLPKVHPGPNGEVKSS